MTRSAQVSLAARFTLSPLKLTTQKDEAAALATSAAGTRYTLTQRSPFPVGKSFSWVEFATGVGEQHALPSPSIS
jgi:hypothetical protein